MREAKAIVFDLDGVLWLSSPVHEEAFAKVCEEHGLPPPDYERLAGLRTDEAFRAILARAGRQASEELVRTLTMRKRALALALLRASPPLAPSCRRVVRALAGRHRLALASSSSRATVALYLEASGTEDCFEQVTCGEDVARGKPAPDLFLRILSRMELSADAAVIVEDAPSGVAAGIAAGAHVVGITGTCSRTRLRAAGAHRVVDHLSDLLDL